MRSDADRSLSLKVLQSKLPRGGAFLLTLGSDINYFSHFYLGGEMLMVPKKGKAVYFVDSMNRLLAERELKASGIRVVSGKVSLLDLLSGSAGKMGIKKIFLDTGNISARFHAAMVRRLKGVKLDSVLGSNSVRDILGRIRAIKSKQEIATLRFAARETVKIWKRASRKISPGMTEIEIARLVDVMVRESGYENSFPTIAATGVNSAYPHAIPGKRKLGKKEHVMVDFGIRHQLYCSDLTRIWGECRMNGQIKGLYENVREAQLKAIDMIRPGVSIKRTAEKINSLFVKRGLGNYIMHGLGHGVGLDIHESPSFGIRAEGEFEAGMVLTVEPGLYVPGKGGARIEDMVLVTPKGREVLTV